MTSLAHRPHSPLMQHTHDPSRGPERHHGQHRPAHTTSQPTKAAQAAHASTTHAAAALADLEDTADRPCLGRHPADATPLGTPTWCQGCTERVERALTGPMGIAELLSLATTREDGKLLEAGSAPGPRVSTTKVPPSPSPAMDEIDDIHRWANDWAIHLATYLGRAPGADDAITAAQLPHLSTALGYLARWSRPALAGPLAAEFGTAVLWVHRRLQRAAGEHDQRRRLRVPCPACAALGLIREDGGIGTRRHPHDVDQIEVECTFCGAAWTDPAFQTALDEAS